jgi:hypothetical protein
MLSFWTPLSILVGAYPGRALPGFTLSAVRLQRSAKKFKDQSIKLIVMTGRD